MIEDFNLYVAQKVCTELKQLETHADFVFSPLATGAEVFDYHERLVSYANLYTTHGNEQIRTALVDAWLPYMSNILYKHEFPGNFGDVIQRFVHMVLRTEQVERLKQQASTAELLAGIAMLGGHIKERYESLRKAETHLLLTEYLGKQVAPEQTHTLEDVVNVLYGPMAWALYKDEVEDKALFARHMLALNIPRNGAHVSSSSNVPNDIA